jgi:DNA polymerase
MFGACSSIAHLTHRKCGIAMSKKSIPTAAPFVPNNRSLDRLRSAAAGCKGCHLWENATQTVFGDGRQDVGVMLVGEQPGDQEDLSGHPFVGPAGRILSWALAQAGIDRDEVYVTNAVKHFKFEPRGKRRIHKKPNMEEVRACRPWLEAEIEALHPRIIVCLGATATQAILGPNFRVTKSRGQLLPSPFATRVLATVHPSSLLRAPDDAARRIGMQRFVEDLAEVRKALAA